MSRALVALVFLGVLIQATGLSLAAVPACGGCGPGASAAGAGDGCGGDEEAGDCAPDCERCLCCAHHRVVALLRVVDSRPIESQAVAPIPASEPAGFSDPNEIMHVPKRAVPVA